MIFLFELSNITVLYKYSFLTIKDKYALLREDKYALLREDKYALLREDKNMPC